MIRRRLERLVLGFVMSLAAWLVERRLIRAVARKGVRR
jgi:hypothetical protein